MERAAPPRASPSILVRITPVIPRASWKPCAMRTASWPVMPSATRRISCGLTAALSRRSSAITSSSIWSRPAVSTRTVRARALPAASMPWRTSSTTSDVPSFRRSVVPSPSPPPPPLPPRLEAVANQLDDVGRSVLPSFRRSVPVAPHPDLLGQRRQLLRRGRAIDIGRDEERRLLLQLEPLRPLSRGRRLPRALQADHENHGGRDRRVRDRRLPLAQHDDQLVVDDLDELLARPHRPDDLLPHRPRPDPREEPPGEVEAHVGFEEHPADLAEPLPHRVFGEHPAAGEPRQRRGELGGELVEHKPCKIAGLRDQL